MAGNYALILAHALNRNVPIVGVAADFVGVGLAATLARPGGNVTGMSLLSAEFSPKWLELLKAAVPTLRHVAFLSDFSGLSAAEKRGLDQAAPRFGVTLTQLDAYSGNIEASLASITAENFDGLIAAEVSEIQIPRIVAVPRRLECRRSTGSTRPSIKVDSCPTRPITSSFGAGADYIASHPQGRETRRPSIEQATQIKFGINLTTASALGLEIPPMLLAAADEVIE